jgi:hypothetical protein
MVGSVDGSGGLRIKVMSEENMAMKTKEQKKAERETYRREVDACDCLSPERKSYIQSQMDFAEDFSDGAFMAFMEESGIDVSELKCFSTTHYAETHQGAQ